jgi:LmbE family N-acetylglucosaminyl deacetylase
MNRILIHRIKKLGRAASVLHVGSHPDDEEIGLLAYISFKHYGRAVYWSATRGEGGQNRINRYQGSALGVYRTWESLAAREIDGAECLFGPFVDFGFSKDAGKTFEKWGKENVVKELVYAIRLIQPQVIVSRWTGNREDGHGQHQAVGQALMDAFDLAGSPDSFPELTRYGCAPWSPHKLYVSLNKATLLPSLRIIPQLETSGFLRINTGEYNHLIGRTYQEQAWIALNCHQTQGINALPAPGDSSYYFDLLKGRRENQGREKDIFDGVNPGLIALVSGVSQAPGFVAEDLRKAEERVNEAAAVFDTENPVISSRPLMDGLRILKNIRGRIEEEPVSPLLKMAILSALDERMKEFQRVIGATLGLRLESVSTRGKVTPGESIWMTNRLWNFSNASIDKVSFIVHRPEVWDVSEKTDDIVAERMQDGYITMEEVFSGKDAQLSCPFWLRQLGEGAVRDLSGDIFQEPFSPALLSVDCIIDLGPDTIRLSSETIHRKAFPGGFSELTLKIVPPISLHPQFDKAFVLVGESEQHLSLQVVARCNDEECPAEGHLTLSGPQDWKIEPSFPDISLPPVDGVQEYDFEAVIPPDTAEGQYDLNFSINCRGRDYGVVLMPVRMGAPGLPHPEDAATCIREEFLLTPSRVSVYMIKAQHQKGRRYAYIQGAKEEMLETLISLGLDFNPLSAAEIAHGRLDLYDAIIVGPNAYLLRSEVRDNAYRLLEFVENGGTLIVQYHGFGYQRGSLAPYPFKYSTPHDRVTNERAPVNILKPDDPLFRVPNPISTADFDGWVYDRGLYFFGTWDERYTPLLSSGDPGEPQKMGGLMRCSYGKGLYLYVGYSLFRQVPAGVPGAFRLLFNILCSGSAESG